jgi:hypothetical protein
MPYRKTYILTKHRITQAVLRKIQRAADHADRSVSEEVGRRLEESFRIEAERKAMVAERDRIAKEREAMVRNYEEIVEGMLVLNAAMAADRLRAQPGTEAAIELLRAQAERYLQPEIMKAVFPKEEEL